MNKKFVLADFGRILARLEAASQRTEADDLLRAGRIQFLVFIFELAWKALKAFGEDAGLNDVVSPRGALREPFKQCWINTERTWLAMFDARNWIAHT